MSELTIRAMTSNDLARACELALEAGWRSREAFYRLALTIPACTPLVGVAGGEIVATGVATVSGPVGWVGTIVVGSAHRGRGYGRTMTDEVCERLRAAGCESLLLIATALGRPLYERMGFRVQTYIHLLQGDRAAEAPAAPDGTTVRPARDEDLPGICALDAAATAEDRSALLAALLAQGGHVLEDREGLRGFVLPSDRGYSPIVAPRREDGLFLVEFHRHLAPDGGHVRAGIADENAAGWQTLIARGWQETWLAPRMMLGPDVPWQPDWVWGQINFAMG